MRGGYGMWTLKEPRECRVNAHAFKSGDSRLDFSFSNVCVGELCAWTMKLETFADSTSLSLTLPSPFMVRTSHLDSQSRDTLLVYD